MGRRSNSLALSPLAGIAPNIAKMSPREYINIGKNDSKMGIEGYFMPILDSPSKTVKPGFMIGKQKMPGCIEAEAKYRSKYPGPGGFKLSIETDWTT
jgi:hypothetical protein